MIHNFEEAIRPTKLVMTTIMEEDADSVSSHGSRRSTRLTAKRRREADEDISVSHDNSTRTPKQKKRKQGQEPRTAPSSTSHHHSARRSTRAQKTTPTTNDYASATVDTPQFEKKLPSRTRGSLGLLPVIASSHSKVSTTSSKTSRAVALRSSKKLSSLRSSKKPSSLDGQAKNAPLKQQHEVLDTTSLMNESKEEKEVLLPKKERTAEQVQMGAANLETMANDDRIKELADKQSEWATLPVSAKTKLLEDIEASMKSISAETFVEKLGNADAAMKGFPLDTAEGQFEATESIAVYILVVGNALARLLAAYKNYTSGKHQLPTEPVNEESIAVQTFPAVSSDSYGPFAKVVSHVWVDKNKTQRPYDVEGAMKEAQGNHGAMIVLGAGNQLFLSAVDCLNGLFVANSVVFLKHHPLRGHHDHILRMILKPLITRGYFDSEVDSGLERTKEIIYHPSVTKVHLTGGKAAHDAIVWGPSGQRSRPILKAQMTSELGCVTPWIVLPQQFSDKELDHQVKNLFTALYSNAGANCNSPKVVILTKDWPQADTFVAKLKNEMESAPVPVAYYPGSSERWKAFRKAYPKASAIGDASTARSRGLSPGTTLLPWLVIDSIVVDLKSSKGRERASTEYAFRNEPFAPVLTIARVDSMEDAVTLCNKYVFGSLSCTVVANQKKASNLEQIIAYLKYGTVALNAWSALGYTLGGVWGAYPGERIEQVESGIGFVNNYCFLAGVQKTVLRLQIIDSAQVIRKSNHSVAKNELQALSRMLLRPGLSTLLNLIVTSVTGYETPSIKDVYTTIGRWAQKPLNILS